MSLMSFCHNLAYVILIKRLLITASHHRVSPTFWMTTYCFEISRYTQFTGLARCTRWAWGNDRQTHLSSEGGTDQRQVKKRKNNVVRCNISTILCHILKISSCNKCYRVSTKIESLQVHTRCHVEPVLQKHPNLTKIGYLICLVTRVISLGK